MKKMVIVCILAFVSFVLSGQSKYTPGYVIFKNGQKQNCYLNNPGKEGKGESYYYKVTQKATPIKVSVSEIKEFGVDGEYLFICEKVSLDVSGNRIKQQSDTTNHAQIEEGYAFLNQLAISEEASLYSFIYEGNIYYFLQVQSSKIHYLVHKVFEIEVANGLISERLVDNRYKDQLQLSLPCSVAKEKIDYNQKSLIRYFKTYHIENGLAYRILEKNRKAIFNIYVSSILNRTSFFVGDANMQNDYYDFGVKNNISGGIGFEYMLPVNKNKWGLFAEANYCQFISQIGKTETGSVSNVSYKYVEFPCGIMYKAFFNDKVNVYAKAGVAPNVVVGNSEISFHKAVNNSDLRSQLNALAGIGICYGHWRCETRIYSTKNLTQHLYNQGSEFRQFSVNVIYTLFS